MDLTFICDRHKAKDSHDRKGVNLTLKKMNEWRTSLGFDFYL